VTVADVGEPGSGQFEFLFNGIWNLFTVKNTKHYFGFIHFI